MWSWYARVQRRWMAGLFCWALLCTAAQAQSVTVRGLVLEKGSRAPVFGAEVFVVDDDALSTSSNEQGEFELTVPASGNYSLGAVAPGYGPALPLRVTVPLAAAPPVIYLQANFTLPEVTVRAPRHPSRVAKNVMTGDESRSVPGTGGDPLKALQALPGVATGSDVQSAPAIRGSRPEDNIYYIDALPVGYLFHMGGIVSVLNNDLVDSFNLHGAAFGPEYGDVTGAAIDVTLRNPRSDRFGAKLNLSLIAMDALLEGPVTGTQGFFLSARRSNLEPVFKFMNTTRNGETIEVPRYYDYQGKYVWQASDAHTLTAHVNGAADTVTFVLTDASDRVKKEPALLGSTSFDASYDMQAVTWDARGAAGMNKLAAGHQRSTSHSNVGAAGYADYIGSTWYVRNQWRHSVTPAHTLLIGASMLSTRADLDLDIKNPRCGGQKFKPDCELSNAPRTQLKDVFTTHLWELYASDRWRAAPRWTLIGGLRWSREDYLDEAFTEPRLALEWQAGERTLVTAGMGEHHQFPRGEQVIEKFGNPLLRHIRAQHRVLGIEQRFASAWSFKLEGYYKIFDQVVLADPDPQVNYRNGASGRAYGVETLLKKDARGPWSGWLALSLSDSQRRNDASGETFPYDFDQPVNATLVLNYKPSADWSFGAKWVYHSGNPYTPILGPKPPKNGLILPQHDDLNSGRLPAYHRLDLRADRYYVFNTWKLNAYLELINAYNRKNVASYDYSSDYTRRTANYQLPLIPSFGVQAEF